MQGAMERPFRRQEIQTGFLREVALAQGLTGILRVVCRMNREGETVLGVVKTQGREMWPAR